MTLRAAPDASPRRWTSIGAAMALTCVPRGCCGWAPITAPPMPLAKVSASALVGKWTVSSASSCATMPMLAVRSDCARNVAMSQARTGWAAYRWRRRGAQATLALTIFSTLEGLAMAQPDSSRRASGGYLYYRHTLPVRVMHWINVIALTILLLSGLNIFSAHPALYWGKSSYTGHPPIFEITATEDADGDLVGVTRIFGHEFDTTGVLGASA